MTACKTFTFADGRSLELHHDTDPMNPRRDRDNLGKMAFFHKNYDIGDLDHGIDHTDFGGWDEMARWIVDKMDGAIVLPVRMYDHSGIGFAMVEPIPHRQWLGTTYILHSSGLDSLRYPFQCPWDSGMVGFMFITKAKLIEEYGSDNDEAVAKATKGMQSELEVYNQYHSGDVYGYILRDKPCEHCDDTTGDELDSSWGFWGDDPTKNGMSDYLDKLYCEELKALV